MIRALRTRFTRHGRPDAGETPVSVMIGLAVFALLAMTAGPALWNFTQHATVSTEDRRMDKALAVLTDQTRREPWGTLALTTTGPTTTTVNLAGYDAKVATWVQPDPAAPRTRKIVTLAVAPHLSGTNCAPTTPDQLSATPDCLVRSAVVAAGATDVTPLSSPLVTFVATGVTGQDSVPVSAGQQVFTITVTAPTRVAVVAYTDQAVKLNMQSTGIVRALLDVKSPTATPGPGWRFANAVVCPTWSHGGQSVALAATNVQLSQMTVLTSPAPASACQ